MNMETSKPPTPPPGRFPLVFDPVTDTVYDLENHLAKELHWMDPEGNPLLDQQGDQAHLSQFWNSAMQQLGSNGPFHPQSVLAEALSLFTMDSVVVPEESQLEGMADSKLFDPRMIVLAQFTYGVALFMSRRNIGLQVKPRQIGEVEMIKLKKKYGYTFE